MNGQPPKICCPKCGKVLNGVTLLYRPLYGWLCGKCASNQKEVLHCEHGSKVKAINLNAGWSGDQEKAHNLLTKDAIYEVESIEIGSWSSVIYLKEFPGERFNTVHFERCE